MRQSDKELLLEDLSTRLPYDVKVQYYDNVTKKLEVGTIISCTIPIDETYQKYPTFITSRDLLIIQGNTIEDIKPYLFPLLSMTEEQKEELFFNYIHNQFDYDDFVDYFLANEFWHNICVSMDILPELINWLNKNHLDWRGLIPKGLALDATGLNIY